MRNRGKLFAVMMAAVALMAGALLTSCGSSTPPDELIKKDLSSQLDPIKNLDQTAMDELTAGFDASGVDASSYNIDSAELIKSLFGGFDYSIDGVTVAEDGKSATAEVTLTCKSFGDVVPKMEEMATQWATENADEVMGMTADEVNAKTGELLMDAVAQVEVRPVTCSFEYNLNGSTWTIADSAEKEITNALLS